MRKLNLKSTYEGIAITIPYQNNRVEATTSRPIGITRSYAHSVIAAWNKHLQLILTDRARKMEQTVLTNLGELSFVGKSMLEAKDGSRVVLGTYEATCRAVEALESEQYKEFLTNYTQPAIQALIAYENPSVQNNYTLEQLSEVLMAADHDCLD